MPQLPSLERWALLPFWGFPTLTCFLFSENLVEKTKIFVQDFVPIRTALRGGRIASSSFILFFYLLYWYYSYIVYFVCAPASEFGAMGSTSFLGFSYPNLLIVFLNLLFFRNLYHIFLAASVGTLFVSYFILSLFFCTILWVSLKGQVYKSSTSTYDLQTDFRTKILSKKLRFLYKILFP